MLQFIKELLKENYGFMTYYLLWFSVSCLEIQMFLLA